MYVEFWLIQYPKSEGKDDAVRISVRGYGRKHGPNHGLVKQAKLQLSGVAANDDILNRIVELGAENMADMKFMATRSLPHTKTLRPPGDIIY